MDDLIIELSPFGSGNKGPKGRWTFDYTVFLHALSYEKLKSICDELKRLHAEEILEQRTFRDGYLTPSYDFLSDFMVWDTGLIPSMQSRWEAYVEFKADKLLREKDSENTKRKWLRYLHVFLTLLYRIEFLENPIPVQKLNDFNTTKRVAGNGAKLKIRTEKADKYNGAFAFRLDGHYKPYNFSDFVSLGEKFILAIIGCFKLFASPTTGQQYCKAIRSFLNYLLQQNGNGVQPKFFNLLSNNFQLISDLDWERMVYGWREQIIQEAHAKNQSILTPHSSLKCLSRFLDILGHKQILPHISIVGIKNAKRKSGITTKRRKSLAELAPVDRKTFNQAKEILVNKIALHLAPEERADAKASIEALAQNLDLEKCTELTAEQLMDQLIELNAARLDAIREIAWDEFMYWHAHWSLGQLALESAKQRFQHGELGRLLDSDTLTSRQKQANSSNIFFKVEDDMVRLGNFLLYMVEEHEGLISGRQGRIHHIVRSFDDTELFDPKGGSMKEAMQAFLFPHNRATTALWILLLVETGANCEVCRGAVANGLHETNAKDLLLTLARKSRANGKPIIDVYEKDSFIVEAITLYDRMTQFMRNNCRYEDEYAKNMLLVHWSNLKVGIVFLKEFNARDWFKKIVKQSEELADLDILPSYIRSSVLIDVQHNNEGELSVAQAIADHSSPSTTDVYTGRTPTRIKYNLKIQEFQKRYQAIVIASIDGAAEKLGLSAEQFKQILSDAFRTGLGVACLDPKAGVQPGSEKGQVCSEIENCHDCKMRWVVATVNNIVDLILFNEHLKASELVVSTKIPERWENVWLPWLVFTDIALSKVRIGETAAVYRQALDVAEVRRNTYVPIPLI